MNSPEIGPDGWDKEAIYDAEIAPLVEQIIAICNRESLPLLLSVVYRESDDTGDGISSACTTHLPGPREKFNEKFARACKDIRTPNAQAFAFTIQTP